MRGTGLSQPLELIAGRFIPAGAGNSSGGYHLYSNRTVHPRGCGEQVPREFKSQQAAGSSPRVRGTDLRRGPGQLVLRFIPAGAGNRPQSAPRTDRGSVHPRGCGEQFRRVSPLFKSNGSSPRVRGTGSSGVQEPAGGRFIPAGAGNRKSPWAISSGHSVHPRGCGEQGHPCADEIEHAGSSPRVRGTVPAGITSIQIERFIPAGAGNRFLGSSRASRRPVHPRGCGEQSASTHGGTAAIGSSPRVRGTDPHPGQGSVAGRFIPAGAGNRSTARRRRPALTVHPRGCGEQVSDLVDSIIADGSSPRVRGTGPLRRFPPPVCRFIPAGAGNSARASRHRA